ncbi:MAG: putative LPS assembly protein LptD [bacterium]
MKKLLIYFFIFIPLFIYGNINFLNSRDSLFLNSTGLDSSNIKNNVDSLSVIDSVSVIDSAKSGDDIDAVVIATAVDSLTFDIENKKMYLYGAGVVTYKNSELKSGKINVDFITNDVHAEGRIDTTGGKEKIVETPVLKDGGENYEGARLKYNFKSKKGFISIAKNRMGDVRYEGNKVNKVDKDTYFIEDGIYTTCNADTPHTHFAAKQMKVIHKDKIIAKWIFMYIGGVPLPIPIPFAVFPSESGRRSGIIIPAYGSTADRGQFFRGFGYFWAINDYLDFVLKGDYYTRGGYGLHGTSRYAKRYSLSGNLALNYSKRFTGEVGDPTRTDDNNYSIYLAHNQIIDPTMNLVLNLSFMSATYYQNNSSNYNDLLTQNITSNATFSKRWEESGNSLSLNYYRSQNLSTGNITEKLPSLTFNKNFSYPFRDEESTEKNMAWYEYIGYSYNGRLENNRIKTGGNLRIRGGVQHDLSISASPKLGYFTISPNLSYTERWYNKRIVKSYVYNDSPKIFDSVGTVETNDKKEISLVRTFSLGVSASTKVYGMMPINNFGIDAVRHTITPSITYRYSPDFSKKFWGYYDNLIDRYGNNTRYNKFENEVFGGPTSSEEQSIGFGIGNLFEMKTLKDPTDTTSQAQKIKLMSINASIGYNFAADSLKLSDLSLSYNTQIGEYLNISGSTGYTFYAYSGGTKINKFLSSQGRGLLRLTYFTVGLSTNLSGDKLMGTEKSNEKKPKGESENEEVFDDMALNGSEYIALYDEQPPDFKIPWTLGLNFNYSFNKQNPTNVTKSTNLSANASISLTEKWKLTVRGSYDFEDHEVSAPQITINRDLHCWEMNFTWNPLGLYRGFNFEIRMKAPELRDIKVTKTSGQFSGLR